MACRIGITTDLEERKKYWESKTEGFSDWKVLKWNLTKEEAQAKETELANKYGCVASPGGPDPATPKAWHVYYFKFTSEKE